MTRMPARRVVGRHRGLPRQRRVPAWRALVAVCAAVVVVGATHAAEGVTGTWASFTDAATVRSSTLSAAVVAAPTGVVCVNDGNQDHIAWTAPTGPAPTSYRVHVNGSATPTAEVGPTVNRWRPSPTLLPRTYANVRVIAVRQGWTSEPSATTDSISTLFLFQGTTC